MKFRKNAWDNWEILIKDKWYILCVCRTCKKIHAGKSWEVDDKIECCWKPDNWCRSKDNLIEESIESFVKKWNYEI